MMLLGYEVDQIVDELPYSGRMLILDTVTIDDEPYYATIVQTRSGRVYARLQLEAVVRQSLIDSGWIDA